MPRIQPTTLAECNAELELAQKQLQQYQNREKVLTRKLFVEERRIRTHRLCARGGYLESIVPELIAMTDEESKDYLYHAVHSEEAKAFLKNEPREGLRNNTLVYKGALIHPVGCRALCRGLCGSVGNPHSHIGGLRRAGKTAFSLRQLTLSTI